MPNASRSRDLAKPRQIEVLVVKSNPADTLLTVEAFHAAGLTSGLSCVTEGEDVSDPKFVRAVYALNGNCFIRKPGCTNRSIRRVVLRVLVQTS